jgi:hypothetical protein
MKRTAVAAICVFLAGGCVLHRGAGGAATSAQPVDAGKVRMFVSTETTRGLIASGDEVLRQRTVAVLADSLRGRKGLAVVNDRARADVVVDVHSPASLFVPGSRAKFDDQAVPVDVRAAGQTTRITESGFDRTRTIKSVAKDIERWIQANYSKIIAARQPAR